jgi:hypothetical protein
MFLIPFILQAPFIADSLSGALDGLSISGLKFADLGFSGSAIATAFLSLINSLLGSLIYLILLLVLDLIIF